MRRCPARRAVPTVQRWLPAFADDLPAAERVEAITDRYVRHRDPARPETRRLRIPDDMPPALRRLLVELARAAATCRAAIKSYVDPSSVGGRHGERIAAGDLSILDEFAATAGEQIDAVRVEIQAQMEPRSPVRHLPGTRAKVEDLARRAAEGRGLHHPDDAR